MAGYGKATILARLTRDPEIKTFANGGCVVNFGVAYDGERWKNKQTGEWEVKPCFLECKLFGSADNQRRCDTFMDYFTKGSEIAVIGKIILETWDDNQGNKRSAVRIVVEDFFFTGGSTKNEAGQGGQGRPQNRERSRGRDDHGDHDDGPPRGGDSRRQPPAQKPAPRRGSSAFDGDDEGPPDDVPPPARRSSSDEDIPF